MPSAVGYQPNLADEMGQLQERITSTRGHSITSMQAIYVPADDYTDQDAVAPMTTSTVVGTTAADTAGANVWAKKTLTNVGSAPVWTGECDDSGFWDSSTVLCTGDTDLLISSTGSTSRPNGPIDLNLQGTTSDMSILIDDSSSGALVALGGHQEA